MLFRMHVLFSFFIWLEAHRVFFSETTDKWSQEEGDAGPLSLS